MILKQLYISLTHLTGMNKYKVKNAIIRAITASGITIIAISTSYMPPIILSCLFVCICFLIVIFEWPTLCAKTPFLWFITPLYPILPFVLLIYMNHIPGGRLLLPMLFLVIWSFDTGSYIIGSMWGKTPIKSSISPGKSWEGALGGLCISSIIYI